VFEKLIQKISRKLTEFDIPYMIIGGQAVLIYGEPRLTKDIDITLGIEVDQLDELMQLVKDLHLKSRVDNIADFVKKTMVLPVRDEPSGVNIDFIFSFSPYERQAIQRAKPVKIGKVGVKFAALEDIIIHKIIAGRARDIEDIKTIILKNPSFDMPYILKWLQEFDSALNGSWSAAFKKIIDKE